jgi:hypothetical protein
MMFKSLAYGLQKLTTFLTVLTLVACGGGGDETPAPTGLTGVPGATTPPVIQTSPQSATMIVGQAASFRVEATGEGVGFAWEEQRSGFAWLPNFDPRIDAPNASDLTIPAVSMDHAATLYRAIARNAAGPVISSEAKLDVVWGTVTTLEPNKFDFGPGSEGFGNSDGGSPSGGDGEGAGAGGGLGKTVQVRISVARTTDGASLGSALTGATSGLVRVKAGPGTAPALITLTGTDVSTYYDEGKAKMLPIGPDQQLHALVTAFDQHLGVTTLTEAAYRYAINQFILDPVQVRAGTVPLQRTATSQEIARLTPAQIQLAHDAIRTEINRLLPARYQLVSIATLPTPVDANSGRGSITNNRYGIMQAVTGGLALAAGRFNATLDTPALTMNAQLADDLTDGVIDGVRLDQQSTFGSPGAAYGPESLAQFLTDAADAQMEQFGGAGTSVPPTITVQPLSATITQGGTTTLAVTATGSSLTYQWFNENGAIPGATSRTYLTGVAGVYRVVVTNAVSSASVTSVTVTVTVPPVIAAPTITTQPVSTSVAAGATATFTVVASGTNLGYQWFNSNGAIAGETRPSFSTGVAGDYRVVVTNASGSTPSATVTLTVTPAVVAPTITEQPASVTIIAGGTATLRVVATGSAPLAYQWFDDRGPIASATAATHVTGSAGSYRVVVSNNSERSVTSLVATVTVIALPVITSQPVSASIAEGAQHTFTVVAVGNNLGYQWYSAAAGPLNGANAASYTTGAAGVYYVVVSNRAGPVTSASATLTIVVGAPVITTQPISTTALEGQTGTFGVKASGTNLSFEWQVLTQFRGLNLWTSILRAVDSTYTTGTAGTYRVIVRNSAGFDTSAAATLTLKEVNPPVITVQPTSQLADASGSGTFRVQASGVNLKYQWYGSGRPLAGETNSTLITKTLGPYFVEVSNGVGDAKSVVVTLSLDCKLVSCINKGIH